MISLFDISKVVCNCSIYLNEQFNAISLLLDCCVHISIHRFICGSM